MSRQLEDRENLMRDATAYRQRTSFAMPAGKAATAVGVTPPTDADQQTWEIFIGVKQDGSWSLYFSQDWVLHFDCQSQLKRLFWHDLKLSVDQRRLTVLRPESSTGSRIAMVREALPVEDEQTVLRDCLRMVEVVATELSQGVARTEIDEEKQATQRFSQSKWLTLVQGGKPDLQVLLNSIS